MGTMSMLFNHFYVQQLRKWHNDERCFGKKVRVKENIIITVWMKGSDGAVCFII